MTSIINPNKAPLPPELTRQEVEVYAPGLPALLSSGRLRPRAPGKRVLLFAIMRGDQLGLQVPDTVDTANATMHKVMDVGPDVKTDVKVGDHVIHVSTAGDTLSGDVTDRYCCVHEDDLLTFWSPSDIKPAD